MMPDRPIRWALRLHPRPWRDRYGHEIRDLSKELFEAGEASGFRLTAGLLASAGREWVRVARQRPRRVALGAVVAIVVVAGSAVLFHRFSPSVSDSHSGLTVGGPIYSMKNGRVVAPDFVPVIGNGRIAGYEPRSYLFPGYPIGSEPNKVAPANRVAPVYARDLRTLVGHEYPGVGFVPIGRSPESMPCHYETTEETTVAGQMVMTLIACPSTLETVPNVVGSVTPTAMGLLSGRSLTSNIRYLHSASIAAGHIVSITPAPGTQVHARSIVNVVSSLGPG